MQASGTVDPAPVPGLPRLRGDLIVRRHGQAGRSTLVVKDPASGRYFRFGEAEAFILGLLDGKRPPETVRQEVEQSFGAPLPQATLDRFLVRLRGLGLLEEGPAAGPATRRRVRGSLLYLRFKAFDPDRVLDRLVGRLGFLFTPSFVILSATSVVVAAAVVLANGAEIARGVAGLYNLQSLLLAWVTLYGVIVIHEFAHGLTCKHFGGSVREMGFMLIYLQPALYCNVSDAWLFPEKSRRLWVTFAGAYVDVVLWALATLVWRLTEPGTIVSQLALVLMATSLIKTLINLNPLIKLDGYYLLSDWLEIPNLRSKASGYLRSRIRWLTGGAIAAGERPTRKEARVFTVYGVLAGVYSTWLLASIGLWVGRSLVTNYQGWGFAVFSGLLVAVFHAPVTRLFERAPKPVPAAGPVRASILRRAMVFVVLAAVLALLWFGRMELKVSGDFTILPARNADVRADVEGIIEEVRVEEGDHVAQGDVIARLSDRDVRSEIEKVVAQIEENQARLRMLRQGARVEEVTLARTGMEKAGERLKFAREKVDMLGRLFDQRLVSLKEYGEAREEVAVRQKEMEEAEERLRMLQAGNRPEEIESVEAEMRRWEAQKRYLDRQSARLDIVTPIAGVITTPKLRERVGEYVVKGNLIAKVHELSTVTAEIAVPEREISDVRIGQTIDLRARSFSGQTFHGEVVSIAPTAARRDDVPMGKTVLVTTRLDNASLLLKPEMTGTAKIHCGESRLLTLVTRRIARTLRVEFWSWW